MRCSHCHSGRMKRAENFGAERMQCGSCGIVTKSAETRVSGKQQELINYLSGWLTERIESAWEVTQDLDQNGISKAINISRSNVPRLVEPLITAGLVRKKKAHILDENNRVTSRMKKWVYYLTREGRQHVTESRRAETFEAEEPFICPECRRASTKSKTSQVCVRCESEYQSGRNPPMRVPWPGDDGYYAETFESETIVTILETADDQVLIEVANYFGIPVVDNNMDELFDDILVAIETSPTSYVAQLEMMLQDETFATETFEASRSDLRRRPKTPFYKIERTDEDEDHDQNKYARTNAGGALWEATYQALRDDGMSHEQAETICNTKFFDHYYEYLIEGLRTPMRNLLNRLQKPSLGLTRKQRKSNRDARQRVERYFPDKASENFRAHEGGHIDDIGYVETFEAPNRYPVRPTRPSEDWPRPTPRPRRPNRRPNPRPRPARRPF